MNMLSHCNFRSFFQNFMAIIWLWLYKPTCEWCCQRYLVVVRAGLLATWLRVSAVASASMNATQRAASIFLLTVAVARICWSGHHGDSKRGVEWKQMVTMSGENTRAPASSGRLHRFRASKFSCSTERSQLRFLSAIGTEFGCSPSAIGMCLLPTEQKSCFKSAPDRPLDFNTDY